MLLCDTVEEVAIIFIVTWGNRAPVGGHRCENDKAQPTNGNILLLVAGSNEINVRN